MRLPCGQLPVVVGAAPARDLVAVSFADVLNEETGTGYQRPCDAKHARDFRDYIERPGATTIPLTFNLRGAAGDGWSLGDENGQCWLRVRRPTATEPAVLARVDCQHRLGMMGDSAVVLTFQCFLGLSPREEMAVFNVINGKAKGLNPSLLDYHATQLTPDLDRVSPELYIAKRLNDDAASVWRGKVKLGGAETQGAKRRVSLRGLQSATKLLLERSPLGAATDLAVDEKYQIVAAYWAAVASIWPTAWARPREHLLTKGVGLNALSLLGAEVIGLILSGQRSPDAEAFLRFLDPLASVDWSNAGAFNALGGRHGASQVHQQLRRRLYEKGLAVVRHG